MDFKKNKKTHHMELRIAREEAEGMNTFNFLL